MTRDRARQIKGLPYELFMLLISLFALVNSGLGFIALVTAPDLGRAGEVVLVMEAVLTPLLIADFLYRFLSAPSRRSYFVRGFGWADLLSAPPLLRILRLLPMISVLRELRSMGIDRVATELTVKRAQATFLVTIFLVFVVLETAGATIFVAEGSDPKANITTAGDAIWWGLVTITTVGYGDQYPVTPWGRVIGTLLLFAGIGLFSVLTGFIANAFLVPRHWRSRRRSVTRSTAFEEIRQLLDEHERHSDEIRGKLDELERSLDPARSASPPESQEGA